MKRHAIALSLFAASAVLSSNVNAVLFDENVTPDVIFGSGNANGSFTVDRANGIELGLRGKLRHNASGAPENTFNSNGDGTYSFNAGVAPTQSAPTAEWSFEWSVNSNLNSMGAGNLNNLTYILGLDDDPSQGVNMIAFDPITPSAAMPIWDHAMGDNSTGNGAGVSHTASPAAYATALSDNNVAQNSWKPHWFIPGFDPTVDGTYDISLAAFDLSGAQLASTNIQIIVGAGGAAQVPAPGSVLLLGLGLLGLVARMKTARA